jgi:hypothetical protein
MLPDATEARKHGDATEARKRGDATDAWKHGNAAEAREHGDEVRKCGDAAGQHGDARLRASVLPWHYTRIVVDWMSRLEAPANALAVLTAMITPAVLISACGALIFSTGTRLGRVIDRVRYLSNKFEELAKNPQADDMAEERRTLFFTQLERQMHRARLIQRAMVAFYSALGVFVATSVAIAVLNSTVRNYTWMAVLLGVAGALFMLYGSVLLIIESRMALYAVITEMEFVAKVSRKYAGEDLAGRSIGGPFTWLGRKIG